MSVVRDGLFLLLCWVALVLMVLLGVVPRAAGHPGRLAADGCHQVHKDFTHVSGKVDRAGTRHCHRPLGQMRLDGREQLEDGPPRYVPRQEDRSREAG